MTAYIILEAPDARELENLVRKHLADGWRCQGGPFSFSWMPGYGLVHAAPDLYAEQVWIYLTLCQAMTHDDGGA